MMNRMSLRVVAALTCLVTSGCITGEKGLEPGGTVQMLPKGDNSNPYLTVLNQFSAGESEYEGFYNQFTYRASLINEPVREILLLREADYFKWSPEQLNEAKAKATEKMAQETEFFISFYTPERKNDNLTDSKSIWRIYLDMGPQRFMGTAKKAKKSFAELQSLYPYHTRWNTPYVISFPVPTSQVQSQEIKFMVTGPLGTKEVTIPAAR